MPPSPSAPDPAGDPKKIISVAEIEDRCSDESDPFQSPLSMIDPHQEIDLNSLSRNDTSSGKGLHNQGTRARGEPQRATSADDESQKCLDKLCGAVSTILECLGEDPGREGLLDTPKRYAKAMLFLTKGYEEQQHVIVNNAVFREDFDGMVIVKDIEFFSLCEHHLLPFFGKMHIGYIPDGQIVGLSKIAKIVDMFSRRLQVQERLTKEVGEALSEILKPKGVAVVVEASHFCMAMRGVQKTRATTTTQNMLGCFESTAMMREEFLNHIGRN